MIYLLWRTLTPLVAIVIILLFIIGIILRPKEFEYKENWEILCSTLEDMYDNNWIDS